MYLQNRCCFYIDNLVLCVGLNVAFGIAHKNQHWFLLRVASLIQSMACFQLENFNIFFVIKI